MNFSRTLASGMEVSDYFVPAITVIEMAQETSICTGSLQNGSMMNDNLDDDDDYTKFLN